MNISMTEQEARSVAAAARRGLTAVKDGERVEGISGPGDESAAYVGCNKLESAVRVSVGQESADG